MCINLDIGSTLSIWDFTNQLEYNNQYGSLQIILFPSAVDIYFSLL